MIDASIIDGNDFISPLKEANASSTRFRVVSTFSASLNIGMTIDKSISPHRITIES